MKEYMDPEFELIFFSDDIVTTSYCFNEQGAVYELDLCDVYSVNGG